MMEIIFHKCEFVGEMAVVRKRSAACVLSYERIEHAKGVHCGQHAAGQFVNPPGMVLMRSYLSGLMENWLFAPDSFDLEKRATMLPFFSKCISFACSRRPQRSGINAPGKIKGECLLIVAAIRAMAEVLFCGLRRFILRLLQYTHVNTMLHTIRWRNATSAL